MLRGDGDRWVVGARDGRSRHPDPVTDVVIQWSAKRRHDAHHARLSSLKLTRSLDLPGIGRVGFRHATARHDNELLLVDATVEHVSAALSGIDAPLVVTGHCHMPFDRLVDRRHVVNSGSVGMPYGHDGASWALVGGDVTIRRTCYDRDQAASRIVASGMPGADGFAGDYVPPDCPQPAPNLSSPPP